jgi:O-antigen ligase
MNLAYLLISTFIFIFLPTNVAERLKPGDPYLFIILIIIAKAFFDEQARIVKFLKEIKTPFLLIAASYFLAAAFSDYPSDAVKFSFRFLILIFFASAVAALLKHRDQLLLYLKVLFWLGMATGLYAIYQIFNPPPVIQGLSAIEGLSNVRVFATFFNANIYAEFLVIAVTLGLGLFFYEKKELSKSIYLLCTGILLFILFYTYSRGSLLAVIISFAFFFLLTYPKYFLPFSFLGLAMTFFIPGFLTRIIKTLTFQDSSQFLRIRIWHTALSSINSLKKLLIGTGPYSFKYEMMDFVRRSSERFFGYFSFQPHNIYILFLVEGGILMLLAWLYFFSFTLYKGLAAFKLLKKYKSRESFIAAALVSSFAGLLTNGLTETIFYHNQVLPFFFLLVGMLLYLSEDLKEA